MERHNFGKERLIAPDDFASSAGSRSDRRDLVPPSHFVTTTQFARPPGVVQNPTTTQTPTSWMNSGLTSVDQSPLSPWLAISQAQQEILELRKENRRIMNLQKDGIRGRIPADPSSDHRPRCEEGNEQWSGWESEWRLEALKHKTEAKRLKRQLELLKDTAERHREEIRDRDSIVNRQSQELEEMREELCKAKAELSQIREELTHSNGQKEKISKQLERLRGEFAEENTKLRRDVERSKKEVQEYTLKAEMCRLQAEEEAKQHTRLSEQLGEMHKKQEVELQLLKASHYAELDEARKTNSELQDRLQSLTLEMLQLKSTLKDVSTERDGLKEHLSQMGQAFETQSATLHSLRNYIGQLAPEKGEKERLNDTVERLNKDKAALQMTTELLTVRLNSVNEILALQEQKMVKKNSTDPLVKNQSEGLQVLQLWREKVFMLCVQLRSKDIEVREEKAQLLSKVRSVEHQLQQEQHRCSVLQHSLDDRIAELDLERVEKETLKQNLAQAHKEKSQLTSQNQKVGTELKTLTEAVHRFRLAFESKVAGVDAAQTRLNTLSQRLTFAKGRMETIQGLIMRKVALQKIHQASKQADQADDSFTNLQTELGLVRAERDKLTQELKRTPELISKSLADLKEQYEAKLRQQQQEVEQSWAEVRQAVAGREEAELTLQEVQAQLQESKVKVEELSSELLSQLERGERALQEKVSEIEGCCAEKLRDMEIQVSTAKREHTKAVMILRQFEREAARKQDEKRIDMWQEHTKREVRDKQQNEMEREHKNLLLATVAEGCRTSERMRAHALQNSAAPPPQEKPSERSCHVGARGQPSAHETLLSVLGELSSLSATVVNSSEDSAEEEEEDRMTAQDYPQAVPT